MAPSERYAPSYVSALREGFVFGTQPDSSDERISDVEGDFAGWLAKVTDQTGTVLLPTGKTVPKVPFSVFWLVEGASFIGQLNLRHRLNDWLLQEGGHVGYGIRPSRRGQGFGKLILRLGLAECRCLGLARVLVTCADDNLASARIIEANGGELENVIPDPADHGGTPVRRYWIELASGP